MKVQREEKISKKNAIQIIMLKFFLHSTGRFLAFEKNSMFAIDAIRAASQNTGEIF